jgi:TatD DNase family protein
VIELLDSHAHVDGPEFDADRVEVLARARAAGVKRMVVIGAVGDPTSAERAVALAEQDPDIFATVATHPHDVEKMTPEWWAVHERLASHPRVVAIGETGLDFYYDHSPRETQARVLREQWSLAVELGLPTVVHNRDSNEEMLAVVGEGAFRDLRADFHSFAGGLDMARALIGRGFYLGFTGMITFPKADNVREVIPVLPPDRCLVETDTPYLAPVPHRGKPNRPGYVVEVAERLARETGETYEQVCRRTGENFFRLFKKAC